MEWEKRGLVEEGKGLRADDDDFHSSLLLGLGLIAASRGFQLFYGVDYVVLGGSGTFWPMLRGAVGNEVEDGEIAAHTTHKSHNTGSSPVKYFIAVIVRIDMGRLDGF